MGLRQRLLIVQLLTLLIVSAGAFSGWWLGHSFANEATRQAQLAARQSQALSELSIALLDALPFGPDYLVEPGLASLQLHLREDREAMRRYRQLLDRRLSDLLLEGISPEVHQELEEIRLLTVQTEGLLRSVERRLSSAAGWADLSTPDLLESAVRQPSLLALKGHSVVLNDLLQRLLKQHSALDQQETEALAAGNRVMLWGLLLAWAGGLLFATRTSDRILRPLELLEQTMRSSVGGKDLGAVDLEGFTRAPREIVSLATSFHQMTLRLAALVRQLEDLALSDALTQVGNRRCFDLTLQREWGRLRRAGLPLSLLIIDVDHFKAYNDTYGHGQGDRCLIEVAAAIRAQGQRPSDLACRIGGEEFALLLPGMALEDARRIAERTWKAVQHLAIPHFALGEEGRVSISIGVATAYPEREGDPESLQLRADAALYHRKKRQGRNGVSVEPGQD